jgi:hypothetical protein
VSSSRLVSLDRPQHSLYGCTRCEASYLHNRAYMHSLFWGARIVSRQIRKIDSESLTRFNFQANEHLRKAYSSEDLFIGFGPVSGID